MTQPNDAIVEAAQALQDYMEQNHAVYLKASEWDALATAALEAAGAVERERICEWLAHNDGGKGLRVYSLAEIAERIKRGDHWHTPPSDGGGNG